MSPKEFPAEIMTILRKVSLTLNKKEKYSIVSRINDDISFNQAIETNKESIMKIFFSKFKFFCVFKYKKTMMKITAANAPLILLRLMLNNYITIISEIKSITNFICVFIRGFL